MISIRYAAGVLGAVLCLVGVIASAGAEIDPKYYREWQEKAPEALVIRLVAVKPTVSTERHAPGSGKLTHTRVDAEATVAKVERTATRLKAGDKIRIRYVSTTSDPPMVGPRPLPVLKRGETVPPPRAPVSSR